MTNIQQATLARIAAKLNSAASVNAGMCIANSATIVAGGTVRYAYEAPVVSGACYGLVDVDANGRIEDDMSGSVFATYEEWEQELHQLIEDYA